MVDIDILEMTEADLPELMSIEQDAFADPWSEAMFRQEILSPLGFCRVARTRPAPRPVLAGYLISWIYAGETHIHNLAVKKEFRRLGIAGRLLEDTCLRAGEKGAEVVYLEVSAGNRAAVNLYEKYGFRLLGIRKRYYRETGEDALLLGKMIGPAKR